MPIYRFIVLTGLVLAFLYGDLINDAWGQQTNNVSPPPLSTPNVHSGVSELNIRALYLSSETSGTSSSEMTGAGLFGEFTRGMSDRTGFNLRLGILGLEMEQESPTFTGTKGTQESTTDGVMLFYGGNLLFELFEGEKKDAAGEVIKIGHGLTFFSGLNLNMMSMTADDFDLLLLTYEIPVGLVGQIALSNRIQIVPFVSVNFLLGGTGTIETDSTSTDIEIESQVIPSYGADIIIRPFRNAPNWKFSIGTVLQQVTANQSSGAGEDETDNTDNIMITFGLVYEQGQHYSETVFGPVLR